MLKALPGFDERIAAVAAEGRVTRQDCEQVLIPRVSALLQRQKKMRNYYELGGGIHRDRGRGPRGRLSSSASGICSAAGLRFGALGRGAPMDTGRPRLDLPHRKGQNRQHWPQGRAAAARCAPLR